MMNKWHVGTFYTQDTAYEEVYNAYIYPSCVKIGLAHKLMCTEVPNQGTWWKNTAQKPKVILDMLDLIKPDECLVFVDADATIERYPMLFDIIPEYCDMAYHTLSWRKWYGYDNDFTELLTGTMFFRNNTKVKNLCSQWYEEATKTNTWEQKILENIINQHSEICHYELPVEYCFMKSRPGNLPPLIQTEPVILHHQYSRNVTKGKI